LRFRGKLRFTGSYYWRRFVNQGRIKPVFPPEETGSSEEREEESVRRSPWREQRVMLSVVVYALLTSLRLMFSPHTFQRLPSACADSKRQRVQALFRSLHSTPKQTHMGLAPCGGGCPCVELVLVGGDWPRAEGVVPRRRRVGPRWRGLALCGGGWPCVERGCPSLEGAVPVWRGLSLTRRGCLHAAEAVPHLRGLAPCGGGCPRWQEAVPRAEGLSPSAGRGRFHVYPGIFHRKPPPPVSFHPLDYAPKHPFSPPPYPLTAKTRPSYRPPPYPPSRPPPQPSLNGIAEAVCISPFALYYAP
jgi:hypothetical protein